MKRKIDLIAPYENHAVILLDVFVCGRLHTLPGIIKFLPKMGKITKDDCSFIIDKLFA